MARKHVSCRQQLLSRGFPPPAWHTAAAASAQRSPGASLKKETNNWINGGTGWVNTLTPCGWEASQRHRAEQEAAGGERGSSGASWRSWRGAWILTAVKIPSLAASHTLNHKDMCSSHTPPTHGLTACNAAGLTLLLQHVCAHMQAQPMHYVKRIIYPEHVITDH